MIEDDEDEDNDLPWWTDDEAEYAAEQFHCLKTNSYDPETDRYRDIRWMYFEPHVLQKYRNNEMCRIDNEHISFLQYVYEKKEAAFLCQVLFDETIL